MTATRRLAAILAADVAGYSRLIGADEEGTLGRRPVVARHRLWPARWRHPFKPTGPVRHSTTLSPTDEEVAKILERVHDRIEKLLLRRGRLPEDPSPTDPVAEQMPLLAGFAAASIQERLATGPRAGHPVRRLRTAAAVVDTSKLRCARLEGFSLHANVSVAAHAREQLEHVCRYLLRPPWALARLTGSSGGQLLYELPHARRDGSTHLLLGPWSSSRSFPYSSRRRGFIP